MGSLGNILNYKDKFLNYLEYEKRFSENTILNYRIDLEEYLNYLKKVDVTIDDIRLYLKSLNEKKYSNATISRKISSLRSFYKYLYVENVIKYNPMTLISNPKKEKKLPVYLNYNDLDKLLKAPDQESEEGLKEALILEMLYSTGVRVEELVNILVKDINFSDKKIRIFGKGSKERYVYFGSVCQNLMQKYLKTRTKQSPYLFINKHGNKLNQRMVRDIVQKNSVKAGLKVHVTPHTLRHTYATHMLNDGADLKSVGELLGHENLSTTQIYTHVSNERLREVYLKTHPRA